MDFLKNKRYINSVLTRVLPNVGYNFPCFEHLRSDRNVINYFKGFRIIQEYPGLYDMFKNRGFDMSLCDKIRITKSSSEIVFLDNIQNLIDKCSMDKSKFTVRISDDELKFLSYRFKKDILSQLPSFEFPSWEQMLYSINRTASSGLPNPFLRKRDFIPDFQRLYYSIVSGKFRFSDIFILPAAAFNRSQIRNSGLKIRVVNAVEKFQSFIESIYYQWFMNGFKKVQHNSCIRIGCTQAEISKYLEKYKYLNSYSIDVVAFDLGRPQIVSIISFLILEWCLDLNFYHTKILRNLRNYYLTMPIFHPKFEIIRRHRGVISGSGFTSLDNSFCNWIINTICIHRYCIQHNIDPYSIEYALDLQGDDLVLGFQFILDFSSYSSIMKTGFDLELKLEQPMSPVGVSDVFFLGSRWVNGKPIRSEKLLTASVIFGTGNFPYMSRNILFQSRFFEVFGNSSDCSKYWKRFGLPISDRLFFFNELSNPHRFGDQHRRTSLDKSGKKDIRGFWFSPDFNSQTIDSLWESR